MSTAEYLKRYLAKDSTDIKKKKRIKKSTKSGGMKIIDDDIDLSHIPTAEVKIVPEDEEDKPVIVVEDQELVNELWTSTKFTTNNWNGAVQVKTEFDADNNEIESTLNSGCNVDFFDKTKKLHKRRKNSDSDISPPRSCEQSTNRPLDSYKRTGSKSENRNNKKRHNSDNSPPRKFRKGSPDNSPPRKFRKGSPDNSPRKFRKGSPDNSPRKFRKGSPDNSPPRKFRRGSPDNSPNKFRKGSPDNSPPRKFRRGSPDNSPPRKFRKGSPDLSPPRPKVENKNYKKNRCEQILNESPPRRNRPESFKQENIPDESPRRKNRPESSKGERLSINRRQRDFSVISTLRKRHENQSDSGLRIKSEPKSPRSKTPEKSKQRSAQSRRHDSDASSNNDSVSCSPVPQKRRRHDSTSSIEQETSEVSQVDAIYRVQLLNKKTSEEEKAKKAEQEAKKKVMNEKYKEWAGGIKQKEMRQDYVEDAIKEMSKPMARYADDVDLNEEQRNILRDGDPMLEYMRVKKAKQKSKDGKERPIYKGPEPPPNRFAIVPGYRWDGVDRSNGFEKQLFDKQNDRKAVKELAYKWSVADM